MDVLLASPRSEKMRASSVRPHAGTPYMAVDGTTLAARGELSCGTKVIAWVTASVHYNLQLMRTMSKRYEHPRSVIAPVHDRGRDSP
ncbi:MAG TPA: hypothetical protein VEK74_07940, partial [Burkholderiaceae bacterium]|nr:hypothetical protein [Burkholderiaceae bacterium]